MEVIIMAEQKYKVLHLNLKKDVQKKLAYLTIDLEVTYSELIEILVESYHKQTNNNNI